MNANFRRGLATAALLGAGLAPAPAAQIRLPPGAGVEQVYAKCQPCHDLQYVVDGKGLLPSQWRAVLAGMKDYGMQISADDEQQVLRYLTTYLGPDPPPAAAAGKDAQRPADGRTVYAQSCAACHGADGRGQAGYYPPLAGNADLWKDRLFPVLVVLHGLAGPIDVGGARFDSAMPAFGHLSDAQIAAVVNYVRTALAKAPAGGGAAAITPETVAAQRGRDMTAAQVRAYRAKAM